MKRKKLIFSLTVFTGLAMSLQAMQADREVLTKFDDEGGLIVDVSSCTEAINKTLNQEILAKEKLTSFLIVGLDPKAQQECMCKISERNEFEIMILDAENLSSSNKDAVQNMHDLFEKARSSSKKVMIVIRGANELGNSPLRNRDVGAQKLQNHFLSQTGQSNSNYMMLAFATDYVKLDERFTRRFTQFHLGGVVENL